MTFKHLLVPAFSLEEDESALAAAAALSARFNAEARALIVEIPAGSEYAAETASLSEVLTHLASRAHEDRERILAWLERANVPFKSSHHSVHAAIMDRQALTHAQLTDLLVMARASATRRAHRLLLELVLFHSGRPTLLTPTEQRSTAIGERIVIGWKPRREAVRAVHDAMPFLRSAREVCVVTVDHAGRGEDVASLLARHGIVASVRDVDAGSRSEGRALLDEATSLGADMIVMGAYGRSRAEEMLFGGVTRELLAYASLPLLLSH